MSDLSAKRSGNTKRLAKCSEPPHVLNGEKCCSQCGSYLPLTAHYWHRDKNSETGFRDTCKGCRNEIEKLAKNTAAELRLAKLTEQGLNLCDQLADAAGQPAPHIAKLLEDLMWVFGGSEGYARHVYTTFCMADPGSARQIKVLELVARLATKVTESGAANLPVEYMSEDDLHRELERRLKVIYVDEDDGTDHSPDAQASIGA